MMDFPVAPAPGWVLVQPKVKDQVVGGVSVALKPGEHHEGVVLEVGLRPKHFAGMLAEPGDTIVYAAFNAVLVEQDGVKCRLVNMQHIAGVRYSDKPVEKAGRFRRWFMGTAMGLGMVLGFVGGAAYYGLWPFIQSMWRKATKPSKR